MSTYIGETIVFEDVKQGGGESWGNSRRLVGQTFKIRDSIFFLSALLVNMRDWSVLNTSTSALMAGTGTRVAIEAVPRARVTAKTL